MGILTWMTMVLLAASIAAAAPPVSFTQEEREFLDAHPSLRLGVGVAFPPLHVGRKI